MLINAQRPEELRIAIVRGKTLENFQVDVAESGLTRGNIYRGTISNIQPSLNAAFIDYGIERHGFLAIQDVVPEAYYQQPRGGQPRIDEVLERGKPIVVQVAKDAIGQKGASLTTSLSLAGRYLVLTPFDSTRGVSRKVEDDDTRKKLKSLAATLDLPAGCGVIMRTNALEQNKTAISRDLAALLRLWKKIQSAAAGGGGGSRLLYTDQDLIVQALRDHLDTSIEEVLVDDDAAYQKALGYMQAFMPRARTRLVRYEERVPLFSRFDLEPQIERIYERRVELPSGGSIVIDATEALTAIDVNSGRSTRAATQEETALNTNLEAATEVARQLRLRDLGGLVVVDFIDMRASKNQRRIEKELREAMKADKARSTVGRISANGLLEINRQRIQQALQVRTHRPCPTCGGVGRLASPEMVSLSLLRRIEARAADGMVRGVRISLHPELADAMQNSRRQELAALEREFDLRIEIIAAAGLHRPDEQLEWTKREKPAAPAKRPKAPLPAALKPWDPGSPAAFSAGDLDDDAEALEELEEQAGQGEQEEQEKFAARPARGARAVAASAPEAVAANGEAADAKRGRKRRRGGRKRKRGAGEPVEGAAEAGAVGAGVGGHHTGAGGLHAGAGESRTGRWADAQNAQDGGGPDEDLPFDDYLEAGEAGEADEADDEDAGWMPAAAGSAAAGGAAPAAVPGGAKRSRRRRRRRGGGKGESAAAGGGGERHEPTAWAEPPAAGGWAEPPEDTAWAEPPAAGGRSERSGPTAWTERPAAGPWAEPSEAGAWTEHPGAGGPRAQDEEEQPRSWTVRTEDAAGRESLEPPPWTAPARAPAWPERADPPAWSEQSEPDDVREWLDSLERPPAAPLSFGTLPPPASAPLAESPPEPPASAHEGGAAGEPHAAIQEAADPTPNAEAVADQPASEAGGRTPTAEPGAPQPGEELGTRLPATETGAPRPPSDSGAPRPDAGSERGED
jgi:ribonuclease E